MQKWKRVCLILLILILLFAVVGLSAGAVYVGRYANSRMDLSLLDIQATGDASRLYHYDFSDRATRKGEAQLSQDQLTGILPRVYVSYDEIPSNLIHAFVAIEDKRFFTHRGVDLPRSALAGIRYMTGEERSFGASTITQQLIKNLTGHAEYTLDRKFTEMFEALDLERRVDKKEILEAYLNVINLANGCEGVGEAARYYFQKEVGELTLSECACIAAITNNPSRYDPLRHPEQNKQRRDLILREMLEQGYISEHDHREAVQEPIRTKVINQKEPSDPVCSWYTDMVIEDVIRDLMAEYGYTRRQASTMVYNGGLSIYTAMDAQIQRILEDYYRDTSHFPEGDKGRPQSAMMVIDPYTGDILGVAGAIGEKSGNRIQNFATDTVRPAGSTVKPLSVYAPALEKGRITWSSLWDDAPWTTDELPAHLKKELSNGNRAWPRNADGLYRGRITAYEALARSVNTVAVKILKDEGLEKTFSFLKERLHMDSLQPPTGSAAGDCTYSSLALGQQAYGVTVRELTGGYTIFENGVYRKPISYYQVVAPDGTVLLANQGNGSVVLKEESAAVMTQMLRGVMKEGSASSSTFGSQTGIEAAGKTGTTQNNCDRWFVGYTPRLLAGVWMGYEYPAELSGLNGNPCIGIWDDVMAACEQIYRGRTGETRFEGHPNVIRVTYCADSGLLPTEHCDHNRLRTGWFIKGSEPHESCTGTSPSIKNPLTE